MKLSVIVPVYNTARYLAGCFASILNPDLRDYEVIVVNDGSTDQSPEIIHDWNRRFPTLLHPVDTPNGGLGHARNVGLALARGEYVLFVDSDDTLADGALEEILTLTEQRFDIAVFDFVHVDEKGQKLARFSGCEENSSFSLQERPSFLHAPMNACNKIWRKSLFLDNGIAFPDRLWFEDLATSPKLLLHAEKILPVHKPWYLYLQRQGSITNATNAERNREMITVVHGVLDYFREKDSLTQYSAELEYLCFYHEFLTSVTRVNLIDPKSPVQEELRDDYLREFPHYRSNPYFRGAPAKYRLLAGLIEHRRWRGVHMLMTMNKKVKGR
ncbi:MAG: glycosyltransferase [Oscillospiraceae bacterium]|nr:glycosyltransferase [Oscillospiraceae bacterium]